MKMTKIFVQTLCILCLAFGYVAESSGSTKVRIEFANLAEDLPTDWRPTAGDSLSFSVKVTKPPWYSGGRLTATLSDVTNYRGSCGNKWSPYNDLELRQDSFHNPGWRVETAKVQLSHPIAVNNNPSVAYESITLKVSCEDYAAYGKLTFTAGGSTGAADPIYVIIPRDANGNKIADSWRNDGTKSYVASADLDTAPMNTQLGDNMTVLDEYRGFHRNGTWTDTDPEAWDVFLKLEPGLSSAGGLPGMTPHYMGINEVNHDQGHALPYQASTSFPGNVYAIRLESNLGGIGRDDPEKNVFGRIGWGPPSSATKGYIWVNRIHTQLLAGQTSAIMIPHTVTHELGHGVNLDHCPNHTDLDCYMWAEGDGSEQYVTQYHSHHDSDYDLKSPAVARQAALPIPKGKKRTYDPKTGKWSFGEDSSGSALLSPSGGLYAATPGSSHTADFTSSVAYSSVSWYVKRPSDTSAVFQRTDNGNGSSTSASYTYTFPSGVSGNYVFTAKGTAGSTGFDKSYTVAVSTSTSTTTPATSTATASTATLTPANGSYTATAGSSHIANLSLPSGYTRIYWYLKSSSQLGYGTNVSSGTGNGSETTASYTYSIPSGASGDYVLTAYTYLSNNTIVKPSYTVTVGNSSSTTAPAAPSAPSSPTPPSPYSLSISNPGQTFQQGDTVTLNLAGSEPYHSVSWEVDLPSGTSNYISYTSGGFDSYEASITYTFPSGTKGDYTFRATVQNQYDWTYHKVTYTVTVGY